MSLMGPGAINFFEWKQTGVRTDSDGTGHHALRLGPGESCAAPVRRIGYGTSETVFWTLPGEYRLKVDVFVDVSPPPKGVKPDENGFGTVWVRCPPLTLHVVSAKGPSAEPLEIIYPVPPLGSLVPPPDDAVTRRLRIKLKQRLNLDKGFPAGTPLKKVMDFLADRYELDLHLDEAAFRRLGKERMAEATTGIRPAVGVGLTAVLYLLLDPLDADWEIRAGKLWIVPLVKPRGLAERLLFCPRYSKDRLEQPWPVNVSIKDGTPLAEALDRFDGADMPIVIDVPTFARAGIEDIDRQPARLAEQVNVPLRSILKRLLEPLGATFVVRDNLIVVVPVPTGKH